MRIEIWNHTLWWFVFHFEPFLNLAHTSEVPSKVLSCWSSTTRYANTDPSKSNGSLRNFAWIHAIEQLSCSNTINTTRRSLEHQQNRHQQYLRDANCNVSWIDEKQRATTDEQHVLVSIPNERIVRVTSAVYPPWWSTGLGVSLVACTRPRKAANTCVLVKNSLQSMGPSSATRRLTIRLEDLGGVSVFIVRYIAWMLDLKIFS